MPQSASSTGRTSFLVYSHLYSNKLYYPVFSSKSCHYGIYASLLGITTIVSPRIQPSRNCNRHVPCKTDARHTVFVYLELPSFTKTSRVPLDMMVPVVNKSCKRAQVWFNQSISLTGIDYQAWSYPAGPNLIHVSCMNKNYRYPLPPLLPSPGKFTHVDGDVYNNLVCAVSREEQFVRLPVICSIVGTETSLVLN